ncbi:fatty-acid amide hydrolase 2-A-like [Pectinophora gossypiella]|uniref:fatty-acid amide hydrolase 2-A-like n=1 Tax=Pectinophora gossypiella TaxID=13191 RepID=UPI00214E5CBD|nr:fatty-acid amide hydrolase 2-A-like [Pectinophora gossypiella]XP_049875838.1 fatty-acid amide hydrolase 2-A-like [Pectinophora gossypiella]
MSIVQTTERPIPLKLRILSAVRLAISTVARFFFTLYYGKEGQKIPPITDDILKQPAIEVARKIRNKEITSVEVLEACIRRIKDVNSALNCFVEDRFELGLKEAREADELIRGGTLTPAALEAEKPLLGVPFTTKDCIAVKGLHHTAGVVLRKDVIAEEDSQAVKLLREKGAIIIGLTNVPELCMWWETHNHIHGRSNNPYNTTRIVGGSSGGEGCLQGAAGSIFGIGSDIGGSIRMPAFFNGIFGHKPSRGVVSNQGQYPIAATPLHDSFLGIGPMTRHAVDLKPILKIISGENSSKLNLDKPVDVGKLKVYYQFSNNAPLVDPVDPDIVAAMKQVVEFLNVQHKIKAEEKKFHILKRSSAIWLATMKNTKKFGEFIMEKSSVGIILWEIIKNLIGLSGNTLIGLFTALFDYGGVEVGDERYKHYLKVRENLELTFKEMLGDDGVFLYPTHPTPAPYHNEPLVRPMNFSYTSIINCLGLPATTVPLGLGKEGLPIGIQVIANHNNDRLCLAVAEELDKAFGGWTEPHKC